MISSLFSESCIQISGVRRSFIMLVFCILASTCTVIFSGEETVASEANGPAFCTIVQNGSPLSLIYPTVDTGWLLTFNFHYLYLATSKRAEQQRSNGAQPCMASIITSSLWNWSCVWRSSTKCSLVWKPSPPHSLFWLFECWNMHSGRFILLVPKCFVYPLLLRKLF